MHGPRKPRASFSVTLLEDPDLAVLLAHGDEGLKAFSVYSLLVVKAKALDNGGVFQQPITAIAATLRVSAKVMADAIDLIVKVCSENNSNPWITVGSDRKSLTLNGFQKWNGTGHGGPRSGSGRRSEPVENQDAIKMNQDAGLKQSRANQDSNLIPLSNDVTKRNVTERNETERSGAEGDDLPATLPTTADAVTPSDRYAMRPVTDAAFAALPPNRRRKLTRFAAEFIAALGRSGLTPAKLTESLETYYESAEGVSRFARDADRFLADDGYSEPLAAWERSGGTKDDGAEAKSTRDAKFEDQLSRVLASRGGAR